MRVDFNVPLEGGKITDDSRIQAALPSIRYVLENGGALILMSHLGRPKGVSPELSLKVCANRLGELLGVPIKLSEQPVGIDAERKAKALKPGEVLLLENLRFSPFEEQPEKNPQFAKELASYGDLYVDDAFGTAHRAHASVTEVAKLFPGKSAAGFLMQKEIKYLGESLLNPKRPFVALIGGAKVSTKMGVLNALLEKVDLLLIGGAMAYTFLKALGYKVGDSLVEESLLEDALSIYKKFETRLVLPVDVVVATEFRNDAPSKVVKVQEIEEGWQGMDIGPETIKRFEEELKKGATVLWNGPLGVFEMPHFSKGTEAIAQYLSTLNCTTIIGGGDSVAAIQNAGLSEKFTHLSTGGGASLEYIELGTLPGIEVLSHSSRDVYKK